MNEFNALFSNTAFVVNFIIQLILIIVFIRMATNIAKIKNHLTGDSIKQLRKIVEKAIFKDEKEKAIDAYFNLLFAIIYDVNISIADQKYESKEIIKKIEALGGTIPKTARQIIKEEIGELK